MGLASRSNKLREVYLIKINWDFCFIKTKFTEKKICCKNLMLLNMKHNFKGIGYEIFASMIKLSALN